MSTVDLPPEMAPEAVTPSTGKLSIIKKLWRTLDAFRGGTIAVGQSTPVCKCPPSPLEGVLLIDRLLRERGVRDRTRLVFFTPYPRAYPAEPMNQIVEPILEQRGIEVMTFFDVDRIDAGTGTIRSIEGDEIRCDVPVVIPPFVGPTSTSGPPRCSTRAAL